MGFWVFFTDDKLEYYDSDDCALYLSSDHVVEIVSNDKTIFEFLISHRNQPMTRLQIQSQIYGWVDIGDGSNKETDRSPIDQAIKKLRGNLDKYSWCIQTVRGHGYKYIGPEKINKDTADAIPYKEKAQDDSDGDTATKVVGVEKETVVSGLEEDREVLRKSTFLISRATGKNQDELVEEIEALIQSWRTSMLDVWKTFSVKQKIQHIREDYFELLVEYDISYSKSTKA